MICHTTATVAVAVAMAGDQMIITKYFLPLSTAAINLEIVYKILTYLNSVTLIQFVAQIFCPK